MTKMTEQAESYVSLPFVWGLGGEELKINTEHKSF